MRFIKFNYNDGRTLGFCLDDISVFESYNGQTGLGFRNGREETLPINIDDFCTKVFSDDHGDNEYQLIEIDEENKGWEGEGLFPPNLIDLI